MQNQAGGGGTRRTILSTLLIAAVGGVVALVSMNLTPRVTAQPAEGAPDNSMLTDILRKTVIIQYRRDAIGLAGQGAPGWADTREGLLGVQGDVIAVRSGWIGIRGTDQRGEPRDVWVPTHAILSIITR